MNNVIDENDNNNKSPYMELCGTPDRAIYSSILKPQHDTLMLFQKTPCYFNAQF